MFNLYRKILGFCFGVVAVGFTSGVQASSQFVYLGVAPTYSMTHFNWTNADSTSDTSSNANGQAVVNGASTTTQVGAFMGYGILIDKVYIGVEGASQFGERSASSDTEDYYTHAPLNNQITMSDIYIIDLRPGYVFNDKNTMIYGIIGLNTASFDAQQKNSSGSIVQDSGSIRQDGIRVGLGYNLGLGSHFMARIEYVFTHFPDFQFTDTSPDGYETHTWDIDPYSNEISLGLSAVFNL